MWRFVRMEWRRNEEGSKTMLVREDTRRKCGQMVAVEIVRKKKWEWRWRNERVERELKLLRLENTPEGRVVSWLLLRWRINEDENERGKKREIEWERNQVAKTFKNTWRKGGETVEIKIWRKRGMRESEMEKRKWEEMKRVLREDRPSNTSDGREVREL